MWGKVGRYRFSGRRPWLEGLVGAFVTLLLAGLFCGTFFREFELGTHTYRFQWRGPRQSNAKVVVVTLDRPELEAWPRSRTFWGEQYAQVTKNLIAANPERIIFDIAFMANSDEDIRAFASRAIKGKMSEAEEIAFRNSLPQPMGEFMAVIQENVDRIVVAGLMQEFAENIEGIRIGAPELSLLEESVVGKTQVTVRTNRFKEGSLLHSATGPIANIPNPFWVNYLGKGVPSVRALDVFNNTFDREKVKDAYVFVGFTDESSGDIHPTPLKANQPGVWIQAESLATVIDGRPLRVIGPSLVEDPLRMLGIVWGVAGVFAWIAWRWRFSTSLIGIPVAVALYSGVAALAFIKADTVLPLAAVWGCALAVPIVAYPLRALIEGQEKSRMEKLFGALVSPTVRDYVLAAGDNLPSAAVPNATVLFLDIRNFVALSERIPTDRLFSVLNELFELLVPSIDSRGGFICRFLGDGFMAVFGSPFPLENPSRAAVESALEMGEKLREWNAQNNDPLVGRIEVGIGIQSGPVLAGNLGGLSRYEFTMIGSTVNIASRLQFLSKELEAEIVVGGSVDLDPERKAQFKGPVMRPIRGKSDEEEIYYLPRSN